MKRVYTDERFPGVEVHNDGSPHFVIIVDGKEEDTFTTFKGAQSLSEQESQRRAQSYFDRMAEGKLEDELFDREDGLRGSSLPRRNGPDGPAMKRVQIPDELDHSDVFNNEPAPHGHIPQHDTITSDTVLDLYQRAKATRDPQEREALMKQVRSMSGQLESEAGELVNRLLD